MPIEVNGQFETDDVLIRAGIDPEAMGYLTGKERREILIRINDSDLSNLLTMNQIRMVSSQLISNSKYKEIKCENKA